MPSITPSLWFENDLEEAAEFYTSVFPNSKIESMNRFTADEPLARRGDDTDEPLARRGDDTDEPLARRGDDTDEPLARRGNGVSGPGAPAEVVSGSFVLDGTRFIGINGGPQFPFTEAVSFMVNCHDQDEVDYYTERLLDGGRESQCGWLKDRFGVSWQIVPDRLFELLGDPDPARAAAAAKAMLGMRKIVIADLEAAANGA
jgi:predicted 3-demethylubiquinone-9 3-methyltransferase (glyoxalase superfamily)